MNLIIIWPKNETEILLLLITKNCETLFKQTHGKAEETLQFKMIKFRENFHFNTSISIDESWMVGLLGLEVYNFTFNIREKKHKFELHKDPFDSEFSFTELQDKVAEVLGVSDTSIDDLGHEIYGPSNIKTYRKITTEKSQTDSYLDYY